MRSASSYLLPDHSAWHITHRQTLETFPSYFRGEYILCGIVNAFRFMYFVCLLALSVITRAMWNDIQLFALHWNCLCWLVNRQWWNPTLKLYNACLLSLSEILVHLSVKVNSLLGYYIEQNFKFFPKFWWQYVPPKRQDNLKIQYGVDIPQYLKVWHG